MRDFIADKELSDTDHTTGAAYINADTSQQEATDNNDEQKPQRTYKKGATLRLDGPIAGLCSLEKGAAYIGLTKTALRAALQRNQMPGHKPAQTLKMRIRMVFGGLTSESGTSWPTNSRNASHQNGTTGKATGHTTARKESLPRLIRKIARPSMENGFTKAESQSWNRARM